MDARPQETVDAVPFHEYRFEDGTVWTEFYRWDSGYLLRFPGIADFEVSADGTDVTAHPAEDCDESTLEHLFINQLLPLALSRQVRPAFHASVVTVPGGAVAFLGKTGMGKSTLAASFALGGSEFLADDSLLIDESRGGCLALPSHASLRLWEDSVEAIVGDQSIRARRISYSSKARLLAGEGLDFCETPQPLLAAFLLRNECVSKVTIQETSGSSRCMDWIEHSFLLDVEDKALLSRHFDWTHRISEAVATYTLDYPRQYGILPKVRSAVLQMVSDDGN
jgi:hypothetical protein